VNLFLDGGNVMTKPRSIIGFGILGALIVVLALIFFFYQPAQEGMLLSDLVPQGTPQAVHVEYEIEGQALKPIQSIPSPPEEVPLGEKAASTIAPTLPVELPKNNFTIQVASFRDVLKAQKVLEDLKTKYSSAHIVAKDLGEKGLWHRVCVGQFATRAEATGFLEDVKMVYKDSLVVSNK
jgi:cell division septation protein DedD